MARLDVDGLWVARYASDSAPQLIPGFTNAGICVFEAGRLFGGDALYFYLGTYRIGPDAVTGRAHVCHFNGPTMNAFGDGARAFDVEFHCLIQAPTLLSGTVWRVGAPEPRLAMMMERKADLP